MERVTMEWRVYDMPPQYTSQLLQYRIGADACMWRRFNEYNDSFVLSMTYSIEPYLHEMMLQSEHRTFDPEEADFFYVPMYLTCLMWPVLGWADHPWYYAPLVKFRYFGMDAPTMAPDEGACYMPTVVYNNSIILTHWGRTDVNHTSGSAYDQDNYNMKMPDTFAGWPGMDWVPKVRGHPCYDPKKDLVIPAFKPPDHFRDSPLMAAPPLERDLLLYFRGDVGQARFEHYSRGIRQKLFLMAYKHDWATKYKIYIGTGDTLPGSYSEHMARSKFCLVAPGDGWSARAEDAVLHGCVPVVIMDGVAPVFDSLLDWSAFSLRVREDALHSLPAVLEAVGPERLARMQRKLVRVWHRFAYASGPFMRQQYDNVLGHNARAFPPAVQKVSLGLTSRDTPFKPVTEFPFGDDAFGTIMQWLYHRINETR
ncbi:hypothetical protein GPECTOR_4g766 [Gonium pectorale]|uniref:Exostosin GT47 domain-containing protein n=1 Tax=Gonium pectorale TaxID=33097 RepID=A0A150GYD9_GONPE|nr:hypothetical protein GPECTOR_4g766 [Gonium pectorale]|eukprot:KXZ54698.1 hypothetical protein GPECTOR_4g766 [Gonium pectorale]